MWTSAARRGVTLVLAVVTAFAVAPTAAHSVSKSQVDQACAQSREALDEYRQAQADFEAAAIAYEQAQAEVWGVQRKIEHATEIHSSRQDAIERVRLQIQEKAVEMYMQGGVSNPGLVFSADSLDELITGSEFLQAVAGSDLDSLDELLAFQRDIERFQADLDALHAELREVEAARLELKDQQEQAAAAAQAAYSKLSGRCKDLQTQYEIEQARAQAARAAREGGAAAGVGSISGFRCPFPGSWFIDSWGYPRSGGRRHKGVDMMGPWNAPLRAVADGVVYVGSGGLGGRTIWLIANNGYAYYYAHLSDWAVSSGQRVQAGQVVGYNGDSGNARGGSPHLHFEIHPGGRGSAAVNPYPTVRAACG